MFPIKHPCARERSRFHSEVGLATRGNRHLPGTAAQPGRFSLDGRVTGGASGPDTTWPLALRSPATEPGPAGPKVSQSPARIPTSPGRQMSPEGAASRPVPAVPPSSLPLPRPVPGSVGVHRCFVNCLRSRVLPAQEPATRFSSSRGLRGHPRPCQLHPTPAPTHHPRPPGVWAGPLPGRPAHPSTSQQGLLPAPAPGTQSRSPRSWRGGGPRGRGVMRAPSSPGRMGGPHARGTGTTVRALIPPQQGCSDTAQAASPLGRWQSSPASRDAEPDPHLCRGGLCTRL